MLGKKRVTCGGEGVWVAAVQRDTTPAGEERGGDDESDRAGRSGNEDMVIAERTRSHGQSVDTC